MIESVFELGDTVVRGVMVPRPDVRTVPASLPLDELRSVTAEGTYTRYLVVDDARVASVVIQRAPSTWETDEE